MIALLALLALAGANDFKRVDRAFQPLNAALGELIEGDDPTSIFGPWGVNADILAALAETQEVMPSVKDKGYSWNMLIYRGVNAEGTEHMVSLVLAGDEGVGLARIEVSPHAAVSIEVPLMPQRRQTRRIRRVRQAMKRLGRTLAGSGCTSLPRAPGQDYPAVGKFERGPALTESDLALFCTQIGELDRLHPLATVAGQLVPGPKGETLSATLYLEWPKGQLSGIVDMHR
ncbi:MAG: hypothetical protein EA397_05520 [Deltaproteobacteria bacterium]|nr:MAG: hypothetical protein EA397_05520 [Deltaproteobacteria bacterium]